jgi:hypothetical protein
VRLLVDLAHVRSFRPRETKKRPAPLGAGRGSTMLTARYSTRSLPQWELSGFVIGVTFG